METDIKYYFFYFEVQDNRGIKIAEGNYVAQSSKQPNDVFNDVQDKIKDDMVNHGFDKDSVRVIIKQFNPL